MPPSPFSISCRDFLWTEEEFSAPSCGRSDQEFLRRRTRVAGASGKLIAYAIDSFGRVGRLPRFCSRWLWTAFIGWFILNAAQESVAQVAIRGNPRRPSAHADVMSKEVPTVPGHTTLEEYSAEVLRTGPPLAISWLATIASWA